MHRANGGSYSYILRHLKTFFPTFSIAPSSSSLLLSSANCARRGRNVSQNICKQETKRKLAIWYATCNSHSTFFATKRKLEGKDSEMDRMCNKTAAIVWFRIGDLRMDDHEPLCAALGKTDGDGPATLLPLFCMDDMILRPRCEGSVSESGNNDSNDIYNGLPRIGPHRLIAIKEALQDLNTSLNALNSELLAFAGDTGHIMETIVRYLIHDGYTKIVLYFNSYSGSIDEVTDQSDNILHGGQQCSSNQNAQHSCSQNPAYNFDKKMNHYSCEESRALRSFQKACMDAEIIGEVSSYWGNTLYHPFDIVSILGLEYSDTSGTKEEPAEVHMGWDYQGNARMKSFNGDNDFERKCRKTFSILGNSHEHKGAASDQDNISERSPPCAGEIWKIKTQKDSDCPLWKLRWQFEIQKIAKLMASKSTMTSFKDFLQEHVPVRKPCSSPSHLPPLPSSKTSHHILELAKELNDKCSKSFDCRFFDFDSFLLKKEDKRTLISFSDVEFRKVHKLSLHLRQLYGDAKSLKGIELLEQVVNIKDICTVAACSYYDSKIFDSKTIEKISSEPIHTENIEGTGSPVSFINSSPHAILRRPPCSETEVLRHLDELLSRPSSAEGSKYLHSKKLNTYAKYKTFDEGDDDSTVRVPSETVPCYSSFLENYPSTRMMAGGNGYSAMVSAALSLGSISPRKIYWKVLENYYSLIQELGNEPENRNATAFSDREISPKRSGAVIVGQLESSPNNVNTTAELNNYGNMRSPHSWIVEEQRKKNKVGYGHLHLLMHLAIRDYFIFSQLSEAVTNRVSIDKYNGECKWNHDMTKLCRWIEGRTGIPFVDAGMRELVYTGWMDNRCRQNSASFLSRALGLQWSWGADCMQALLLDHDQRLNLGNWRCISGVGIGVEKREFKTVTQGERYDPLGDFIAAWVPELALHPTSLRHRPWNSTLDVKKQKDHGNHRHISNEKSIEYVLIFSNGKEKENRLRNPLWRIQSLIALVSQIHENKIVDERTDLKHLPGTVGTFDSYPRPMVEPSSQIGKKRAA